MTLFDLPTPVAIPAVTRPSIAADVVQQIRLVCSSALSQRQCHPIQAVPPAAYEGPETGDLDGETLGTGGNTNVWKPGPVNVFLEVLRDVNAVLPNCVDTERLRQRTVLHETMHRFGHDGHDVAVMDYDLFWTAPDNQIELVGVLLRKIQSNNPF